MRFSAVNGGLAAFLVGFTLAFVSCEPTCTAATCQGCCAADGQCVDGTTNLECGKGGEACMSCTLPSRCSRQTCAEPVDAGPVDAGPTRCLCETSCCFPDGTCAPNNEGTACGPRLTFCGTCASGQRCMSGTCVEAACTGCLDALGQCRDGRSLTSCGSDGGLCLACGANQTCTRGRCVNTTCDQNTCRFGCCRVDLSCQVAVTDTECGISGAPCEVCTGGKRCINGGCF